MITVAFDIGDMAIFHVNVDPAAAGAHVAGRLTNFVGHLGGCIDKRLIFHCGHPVGFRHRSSLLAVFDCDVLRLRREYFCKSERSSDPSRQHSRASLAHYRVLMGGSGYCCPAVRRIG